jgi:UDP-N-acetylglucosamine 2-epimerase (non-hydrolysing)
MKIMTVLGTRPEIIRLSRVIEKLDGLCEHTLVHTGQNFAPTLNELFFEQLRVRRPDHMLGIRADTFGEQVGMILSAGERVLAEVRPDRLLLLGDTNSVLVSVVAKRMGIPVFHMEAGNRCYDDRVPEEVNRRIVDHTSDVLMPYTERSRANLLREGFDAARVFVTGNPIHEVLEHYRADIEASDVLTRLGLERGRYFLVTIHRAENVDVEPRLRALLDSLDRVAREYGLPIICSTHPRTQARLDQFAVSRNPAVQFQEPFGLFDFVALEQNAFCVMSDSGTVQEECCLFHVPNVTLRDVTERPETVECGSNILTGVEPDDVLRAVRTVTGTGRDWIVPPEYLVPHVSETVARIVLGYNRHCNAS